MYVRRINYKNQRWYSMAQRGKYFCISNCRNYSAEQCSRPASRTSSLIGRHVSNSSLLLGLASERTFARLQWRSDIRWRSCLLRLYSSEGDGRNASEDKCTLNKDVADSDKKKIHQESTTNGVRHCDAHARLGEHDQIEWLKNEKLAIENRKKESPFLTRRERFKNEFLRRVVPWEKITVSWDTFPYYLQYVLPNI